MIQLATDLDVFDEELKNEMFSYSKWFTWLKLIRS